MSIGSAESSVEADHVSVVVALAHKEHVPALLTADECLELARQFYRRKCAMLGAVGLPTNLDAPFAGFTDDERLEQYSAHAE